MAKRVFLIVLDSVGIGEMPDSAEYGDAGSNTVRSCAKSESFSMPNMERYGLFDLEGIRDLKKSCILPWGACLRMSEASKGKDTTIGHWEISGIESERPLPVFPDGFPEELIKAFEEKTGRIHTINLGRETVPRPVFLSPCGVLCGFFLSRSNEKRHKKRKERPLQPL